ncbi:MAG TPA: UDP-2,3-diacylglucosamine diphosphatase, partial [Longimicrobiales bacterium]|nr:UDP-2,3-diacylglucosamine diphosphatase [Longimicrobiales bacterium]
LLLAGDLFDFWFEYGSVIPGKHFRVLAALADLVDGGVPVTMIGGNHDAWGGRFLEQEVGASFHATPVRTDLAGRPALVAHGDGVGRGDLKYRLLKAILRSRVTIGAFRALHPELGVCIARAVSTTESKADSASLVKGRADHIQAWALAQLASDPTLAWVVCGHAHLPAVVEAGPGRYYLNAGDWVVHNSYIRIGEDGAPRLLHWAGAAG